MSFILEYKNTKDDLRAQYELQMAKHFKAARPQYFRTVLFSTALLVMASYCAYEASLYGFLIAFLVLTVSYLFKSLPYSRNCQASIEKFLTNRSDTQIRMEVKDDGLLETEEGIQSFVPWSSIKNFTEFRGTLFINLNAGLYAMIPRDSVTTDPTAVDQLIAVLREKGITEELKTST
jgi:Ca2+/Na+ antiporter